jgi:4-amino-4-deoxy-L-arabinose transferase-like glycosyltransferase
MLAGEVNSRTQARWRLGVCAGLIVVFKLWLASSFPMTGDEAYFTVWGLRPDFGYYDHPPMVGWLLALLAQVSTSEWVLRLPVVLLPVVVALVLYHILENVDLQKAFYAAVAYLLLPINVWNVFITTDTPLVFFCFCSALAWWRARECRSPGWYGAAGILLGLAFLSKYFAVLLALVYLVDAACASRSERPWRGLAVTCAAAVPFVLLNLWWNYQHCWANLMFNLYNRHDDAGFSVRTFGLFALIVAYTLSPVALVQMVRRRTLPRESGARFFMLAAAVPFAVFAALSFVREVGLHWVLSFVPFFFLAAALTLRPEQLRASAVYLAALSLLHILAIVAAASLPLQTWKSSRLYDGIVFHFRIHDVVDAMKGYSDEFELAADGYSPAVTASYYAGRYVFVFGTASSHARHDDLLTDFRALQGKNILVFRKNRPDDNEYRAFFRTVELRTLQTAGVTFYLVLGRGFDYDAYRDRVLSAVRDRYYRIPRYLPQGGCVFCERYFGSYCPVRG